MALEDIKNKILSDARAKKKELLDEAEAKKREILSDYRKRAGDFARLLSEKAVAEGEGIRRGIVIDAKTRRKSEALKLKRELLNRVFDQAKAAAVGSADYPKLVEAMVRSAGLDQSGDREYRVVLSRSEKQLDEGFVRDLGRILGASLTIDGELRDFAGGVILKAGDVEYNMTVDAFLDGKKEDLEREIAKILFGHGDNSR